MLTLYFSRSDDQGIRIKGPFFRGRDYAYKLLRILNPEKNRSNELIGRISNIGNCYHL